MYILLLFQIFIISDICPPIETSISEEVICKLNDEIANCLDPKENMSARIRCREFYTSNERPKLYHCHDGKWDEIFAPCIPGSLR